MRSLVLAVLVLVTAARAAHADEDCDARLAFVSERLHADGRMWRTHQWVWGIGFSTVAIGQFGLGAWTDDDGARAEMWVGAGKSVLGLLPVFVIKPVTAGRDADWLDARVAATPAGPERCALVAEAERRLERVAANEDAERGWLPHTLNILVNGGGLLILGLGYDNWTTASLGALAGATVGAVRIYSRPTGSLRARRAYRTTWGVAPMLGPGTSGLVLSTSF